MPQLLVILAVGAGLAAGYKWLAKATEERLAQARRAAAEAEARMRVPKEMGELEWDEAAGVYRPRRGV